jgi:glycosyltransferase involved in cell wall biosynthesis
VKIIIFSNTSWSLYNFRLDLIKKLSKNNEILLIANNDKFTRELNKLNCKNEFIKINSHGKNLFKEGILLFKIFNIIKKFKPDLILSYTIKPNIYSLILKKIFNFKIIINITGLGNVFEKKNLTFYIVSYLYSFCIKFSDYIFFQNFSDYNYFLEKKFIDKKLSNFEVIPGSGVDSNFFKNTKSSKKLSPKIRFIYSSRFIKEKGIINYLNAAKHIKKIYKNVYFYLVGFNSSNKNSQISDQINNFSKKKYIINLGFKNKYEIKNILEKIDCFVLPTYYNEGVPRSLLEAISMEVFIILGEKLEKLNLVKENENGFYSKSNDTNNLINVMKKFINLNKYNLRSILEKSRKNIITNYHQDLVILAYEKQIEIINNKNV